MTLTEAVAAVLVAALSAGGVGTAMVARQSKARGVTEEDVADTARPVDDTRWDAMRPVLDRLRSVEARLDRRDRLVRVVGKRLDLNTVRLRVWMDSQPEAPAEVLVVHDDLMDLSRTMEDDE